MDIGRDQPEPGTLVQQELDEFASNKAARSSDEDGLDVFRVIKAGHCCCCVLYLCPCQAAGVWGDRG